MFKNGKHDRKPSGTYVKAGIHKRHKYDALSNQPRDHAVEDDAKRALQSVGGSDKVAALDWLCLNLQVGFFGTLCHVYHAHFRALSWGSLALSVMCTTRTSGHCLGVRVL